jgi:hypothetical protein
LDETGQLVGTRDHSYFPQSLAYCERSQRLYVGSYGEVTAYSIEGKRLLSWKLAETSCDALAVDADGQVYSIGRDCCVRVYSPEGEFVRSWGSRGSGDGRFGRSAGIAIASSVLYVSDFELRSIQAFSTMGKFLGRASMDVPRRLLALEDGHLLVDCNGCLQRWRTKRSGDSISFEQVKLP